MGKWDAFVSPRRAAKIIGVHHNTVYRWCDSAARGETTPLTGMKRGDNGYIKLPIEVVLAIRNDRSVR